jgi:hypothetical protein
MVHWLSLSCFVVVVSCLFFVVVVVVVVVVVMNLVYALLSCYKTIVWTYGLTIQVFDFDTHCTWSSCMFDESSL